MEEERDTESAKWTEEIFPFHYPSYHPHIIQITRCVAPCGYVEIERVSFDHLFYMEHYMVPSRSFFMIEYSMPLRKNVIEHVLRQVQEIHMVFSKIGQEDGSQEYMDMIQQIHADTGLTPHQCDLPFRILFSHPVTPLIHQYLSMIHDGIAADEYDYQSYKLCMDDHRCIRCIKKMEHLPHYPYSLRGIEHRYHTMSIIHYILKEHGYHHHVTYPLSDYFIPYEQVKDLMEVSKGRIEMARLEEGGDCYPSDHFPEDD